MKKSLTLLLFFLNFNQANSQDWYEAFCINFEDPQYLNQLFIENSPVNTWQIGPPQKTVFIAANSAPNAIVTDTINPYPPDNTSVFEIKSLALDGMYYGCEMFYGFYYVQSDTLNDFGKIEFSPDNGGTWVDLINDTTFNANIQWYSSKPVLTGNSGGWNHFDAVLCDLASILNIQYGDTVIFRFTFTSDNVPDNYDGLMYDDICFFPFIEGISEIRFKPVATTIYPNPSSSNFTISFKNPNDDPFQLNVYNSSSKLMFSREGIRGTTVGFGKENLPAGIYFYKLTNSNKNERGWGKFIVSE
jgi:hypothetical protein